MKSLSNLSGLWKTSGGFLKKMEILPRVSPKKKGDATPMVRNPQIVSDFAHMNSTGVSPSCTDKPRTCLRLFGCRLKILQSAGTKGLEMIVGIPSEMILKKVQDIFLLIFLFIFTNGSKR